MNTTETLEQAVKRLAAKPLSEGYVRDGDFAWPDEQNPLYWSIRLKHPKTKDKWIRPMYLSGNAYVQKQPEFKGPKPLYQLRRIFALPDREIWITEGENKVEALHSLGIPATTSGGAQSAEGADWSQLKGWKVIIWRDNDDPGLVYAQKVTEVLRKLGCSVEWVDVAKLSLPEKGDCVDWLKKNPEATADDIKALPRIVPPNDEESWEAPVVFDEIETPEIPASLLPGVFGELAAELAEATETPPALAVMSILGILSTALARRFVVCPMKGWKEPVNLYILVAVSYTHLTLPTNREV